MEQNEILYSIDLYQNYFGKIQQISNIYVVAKSEKEAFKKAKTDAKLLYGKETEILVSERGIQSHGKVM